MCRSSAILLPTPGTVNRLLGSFIFLATIVHLLIFPQLPLMSPNGPAIWGGSRCAGQIVLPNASTGWSPGILATKLSRRAPREQSEQRGCKNQYKFVFSAGANAKSVTTGPAQRETTYPYCPC